MDLVKAYGDARALQVRGGTDASHALAAVEGRLEAISQALEQDRPSRISYLMFSPNAETESIEITIQQ